MNRNFPWLKKYVCGPQSVLMFRNAGGFSCNCVKTMCWCWCFARIKPCVEIDKTCAPFLPNDQMKTFRSEISKYELLTAFWIVIMKSQPLVTTHQHTCIWGCCWKRCGEFFWICWVGDSFNLGFFNVSCSLSLHLFSSFSSSPFGCGRKEN